MLLFLLLQNFDLFLLSFSIGSVNTDPSDLGGLHLLLHLLVKMLLGRVNVRFALCNEDIQRHGRDLYLLTIVLPLEELLHNGQALNETIQGLLDFLRRTADSAVGLL